MIGLLRGMMPQAAMVKQLLMASGVDDPIALRMVDRLTSGGLSKPETQPFAGDSFPVPPGSECLVVSGENSDETLLLLMVARKKTHKTLDARQSA